MKRKKNPNLTRDQILQILVDLPHAIKDELRLTVDESIDKSCFEIFVGVPVFVNLPIYDKLKIEKAELTYRIFTDQVVLVIWKSHPKNWHLTLFTNP